LKKIKRYAKILPVIMSFFMNLCLTVLSSVVFALALPNELLKFGSAVLGFFALIPLYVAFSGAKNRKVIAVCFGTWVLLLQVLGSFWLLFFRDFAIFTLGASSIAYFFLGLWFAPAFYEAVNFTNVRFRPLFFAIVWTFWEWFKSNGFFGYPWGTLEMTAFNAGWLKQIADITGVWGISFVIAFCAASVAQAFLLLTNCFISVEKFGAKNEKKAFLLQSAQIGGFALFVCVICSIYSFVQLKKPLKQIDTLKIALVQPNIDRWDGSYTENLQNMIELTERLLKNSDEPDLILWNEGSLVYSFPLNLMYYYTRPEKHPFVEFLANNKTPLFVGTTLPKDFYDEAKPEATTNNPMPRFFTNSVCLLSPDCEIVGTYAKTHLVPFAEYMPLIEKPWVQKFFSRIAGFSSAYVPGRELNLISLTKKDGSEVHFSAPICFEDAFPSLCADLHNLGSELMINLTDDSWSHTDSAEYQHFVVASFRTIELRTTLIRSTNSGYSCVIDPKGAVIADLPLFTSAGLSTDVPIYEHTATFYSRFKDWFPFLCVLFIFGFTLWKFAAKKYVERRDK
jgi:apolipoprotein N-acyltransferase